MHRRLSFTWVVAVSAAVMADPSFAQPEATLGTCSRAASKETRKFSGDYIKAVSACLDAAAKAVIAEGAPAGDAAAKCAKAFRKLVNSDDPAATLNAKLAAKIGKACDPAVNPDKVLHAEGDVLGTGALAEQIDAQDLAAWCELHGVAGGIDDLDDWVTCLTNAATCSARRTLATQYPRMLEFLGDVRPAIDALDDGSPDTEITDALAALDALDAAVDGNNDLVADIACGAAPACAPGQEFVGGLCQDCGTGHANNDGLGGCEPCAQGSFAASTGSAACMPCPAGSFASATGQTSCSPCSPGTEQPSQGASSCDPCAAGTFSDGAGAIRCELCAPGSVQASTGQTNCSLCPSGSFQPENGQISCTACAMGSFSASPGASSCTPCGAGTFAGSTGATTCSPCATGTFQSGSGGTACNPCAPGTFASGTGTVSCTNCSAGTSSNSAGASDCGNCVFGFYQDAGGQTSCKPCPAGTFGGGIGLTACTDCVPGRFASSAAQTTCPSCAANTYAPQSGMTACLPCTGAPGGSASCTTCTC